MADSVSLDGSVVMDVAVGALVKESGEAREGESGRRLLIAQRGEEGHLPGYWELPGGKCEGHESVTACLHRELREELGVEVGVDVQVVRALEAVEYAYSDRHVRLHAFVCALVAGEPEARTAARLRWIEVSEMDNYRFPPANRAVMEILKRELWP